MAKYLRMLTILTLFAVLVFAISACANKGGNPPSDPAKQQVTETTANKEQAIMDNFSALMQKTDVAIPEIIKFIDDNINAVSQANAATMIIGLEKVQKAKLPKLQDKFADSEAVQKNLTQGYKNDFSDAFINSIQNKEVKDLLLNTKQSGFKIETAEGMFFPVIDYSFYKKYRQAVTQDMATYIDIMAVESEKTPVKDAGLMISWSEVLKRAFQQEHFIREYGNSVKAADIQQLLKRYASFALYGTNNTPLFSYETRQMVSEAKRTYLETTFDANKGSFSKVMNEYLSVLKKNDYKLTNEVQEYRNKAINEIR